MRALNRRQLLGTLGLAGAGLAATAAMSTHPGPTAVATPPAPIVSTPDDGRYGYLVARGQNRRFTASPQNVRQVFSADQIVAAVGDALRGGQRIAVRSGGHCADELVDNPATQTIIDMSRMDAVTYDGAHRAFSIESGALLGDVYKKLVLTWNVVLPAGSCPTVGVGGYVQGGGFGALCRSQGMCVDHLYGVEVVTVDRDRTPRMVLATREPDDPNRDLWWAHTGAGGGSLGVVTRYLFRSPSAAGPGPTGTLPTPPKSALVTSVTWQLADLDARTFRRLITNHGMWHAANSAPGTPFAGLFSGLILSAGAAGAATLVIDSDGDQPDAADRTAAYVAAISTGVPAGTTKQQRMPWLDAALGSLYGGLPSPNNRTKGKGAYLKQAMTPAQIDRLHSAFVDPAAAGGSLILYAQGGAISAVAADATAFPHRDSSVLLYLGSAWSDPAQDARQVDWVRDLYRDLFADTGGVPVPSPAVDGSYVNYPDLDLLDPAYNWSGVSCQTLYYGENYGRLQQVKRRYDPADVFRHQLSIRI